MFIDKDLLKLKMQKLYVVIFFLLGLIFSYQNCANDGFLIDDIINLPIATPYKAKGGEQTSYYIKGSDTIYINITNMSKQNSFACIEQNLDNKCYYSTPETDSSKWTAIVEDQQKYIFNQQELTYEIFMTKDDVSTIFKDYTNLRIYFYNSDTKTKSIFIELDFTNNPIIVVSSKLENGPQEHEFVKGADAFILTVQNIKQDLIYMCIEDSLENKPCLEWTGLQDPSYVLFENFSNQKGSKKYENNSWIWTINKDNVEKLANKTTRFKIVDASNTRKGSATAHFKD